MPPKRKGAAAKGAAGGKKKKGATSAPTKVTLQDKVAALKKADQGKTRKSKPDSYCAISSGETTVCSSHL